MTSVQTATLKGASSGEVLISLALLNLNWEQGRSFVDYFKPFVIDVARGLESPFTADDARKEVHASFGIELPTRVATNILKRLVQDGDGRSQTSKVQRPSLLHDGTAAVTAPSAVEVTGRETRT